MASQCKLGHRVGGSQACAQGQAESLRRRGQTCPPPAGVQPAPKDGFHRWPLATDLMMENTSFEFQLIQIVFHPPKEFYSSQQQNYITGMSSIITIIFWHFVNFSPPAPRDCSAHSYPILPHLTLPQALHTQPVSGLTPPPGLPLRLVSGLQLVDGNLDSHSSARPCSQCS